MDIDKNALAKNYAAKSDNELLDLHSSNTLTNDAYEVLEAELTDREIVFQLRSSSFTSRKLDFLKDHWYGLASLASAYWLIGVLGSLILSGLYLLLALLVNSSLVRLLFFLLWVPYVIFALVSIWQCAWNTSWKGWGYIARILVILSAMRLAMFLFWEVAFVAMMINSL